MKIDPTSSAAPTAKSLGAASTQVPNRAASSKGAGSAPQQENVQLSGLSTQIQALEANLAEVPGIDLAKVEAIKLAISEGRFTINAEAIADKLIASTRELLAKQG